MRLRGHTDADQGMQCSALAAQTTLRHDILTGILRRAVRRAVHRPGARGDILLTIPQGISIADVSVIHPLSINSLSAAAASAGAAVAWRDHQKRTAYAEVEPNGYDFVSFSVESYGHIGQPAMKHLHQLGHEAASPGGVTRASFLTCNLHELSVGLCKGNTYIPDVLCEWGRAFPGSR
jgi:hypothetical protein